MCAHNAQFGYKGTTKNAHTQVKREINRKKDRFNLSHALFNTRPSSLGSEVLEWCMMRYNRFCN